MQGLNRKFWFKIVSQFKKSLDATKREDLYLYFFISVYRYYRFADNYKGKKTKNKKKKKRKEKMH